MAGGLSAARHSWAAFTAISVTPRLPTGVTHNIAHRNRMDRIVTRDGHDSTSIGHHDVLALPDYTEPRLLQGANRIEVIGSGQFRHD